MNLQKILSETADSTIYLSEDDTYPGPYIVKVLKADPPDPLKVQQFYNEYEITKNLDVKGIRKAYDSMNIGGKAAIALQYIDGLSLKQIVASKKIPLDEFLRLGVQMTEILHHIHENNIIHKDVNSKNILVDKAGDVYIIDFGISARLTLKAQQLLNPGQLEGSLAYLSPEQTGRMNRAVDYRTDFYSLGVSFYEMLSGVLPFQANDPIELVHCHIAKKHEPLQQISAAIPEAVSAIVDKLLSKNAEDRYQSALGIKHDLQKCLADLNKTGFIAPFAIATNDYSGHFRIPQKLYGREGDMAMLLQYFEKATEGGNEMITISGYSGVGKSALVHEINKPVTEKRAFFLEGKFDQFQRNTPYSCFLQAFDSFIGLVLSESSENLKYWRDRFQAALGENGRLLTDIVPRLELIIGKQPDVVQAPSTEALNRFNYTFIKFLNCIAAREHPLVLFADDLQWADAASLSLIKQLLTDKSVGYLLFIGAYRDNETDASHPWIVTLNEIKESNHNIGRILLKGLDEVHVNHLTADTLNTTAADTKDIAEIIYSKTKGNPFFVNEFLKSLYASYLIIWDANANKWRWSLEETRALDVTDNVVHFLAGKIQQLPEKTRQVLQYASCIGSRFSIKLIGAIFRYENTLVTTMLYDAVEAGYIIPFSVHDQLLGTENNRNVLNITYKFAHDRIQQAIYSSISEDDRQTVHYKIGHYLLENSDLNVEIFEVTNHLNKAHGLNIDKKEFDRLAHLNFDAGKKAKNNNAHDAALNYFRACLDLLDDHYWADNFDFIFDATLETADEEFINGREGEAEKLINRAFEKGRNSLEKGIALIKKIMLYAHQGKRNEAVTVGRQALAYMNINLPKSNIAKKLGIAVQLLRASIRMKNKSLDDILNLPELSGKKAKTVTGLVGFLFNSLYYADPELFIFMSLYMVGYSFRHGNSSLSPIAYVSLGIVNEAVLQNYKKGRELYEISHALNKKYENSIVKGRLMLNYCGGFHHWTKPAREVFDQIYECYKVCLENGDMAYAGDTVNVIFSMHLFCGKQLDLLKEEFQNYHAFIERVHDHNQQQDFLMHNTFINNLLAEKEDQQAIAAFGDNFIQSNTSAFTLGYYYVYTARYHYIMGRYDKSLELAKEGMKAKQGFAASILENQAVLIDALARAANYENAGRSTRRKILKTLAKRLKQFKKWALSADANFGYGAILIEAEIARINKQTDAIKLYKKAIQSARDSKFVQMEALINEMLGNYCLAMDMQEPGFLYIREAGRLYEQWGARAKVNLLKEKYPQLFSAKFESGGLSLSVEDSLYHSNTSSSAILDMMSVLKASNAISSEIKIGKLLDRLLNIVLENAGAQRGVFLVTNGDQYLFKSSEESGDQAGMVRELPEALDDLLPYSIAQYVYRTKETVVIDDIETDTRFSSDPYIRKNKPRSALFIPIIAQGNAIGGLYLENKLLTGAFGPNRMELLRMLSGQIAISVENALLYENLELKVEERTKEINDQKAEIEKQKHLLEKEKQVSDELLLNILPAETAEELKLTGKAKARKYEQATVMFADIIAFTKMAELLSPEQLVDEIDYCFSAFDEIIGRHNIEKIKTIGDAYMCAGGISNAATGNVKDMLRAVLEIQQFMEKLKQERILKNEPFFELRTGVNTGPVVAGVVGSKKFAYDIWGDTVNLAARMEQTGEAGKVNISENTYNLVKDSFECTFRGKVEAKNKGGVEMYFVEREMVGDAVLNG